MQIERIVEPKLGTHVKYIDKEPKTPKFKKDGTYNAVTCRILSDYFGHEVKPEDTHLMPAGTEFQRTVETQIDIGQIALVKEWLLANGWEPDDYTRKKINGAWVNQGPKLTDTSLTKFGRDGELISEYYTLRNRLSVLEGWLSKVKDGRLHGNMWTIGTPSMRCRHEVIVNLPSVDAAYGKPLREMLLADEGEVIVGCDSAGNQLRGLAHYMGNPEFTNEMINGDQHQRNADALTKAAGFEISRGTAKGFLYCFMFGGGPAKLGEVLRGYRDPKLGTKCMDAFAKSIPGLRELKDRVEGEWAEHEMRQGVGWVRGLDGRPIFVEGAHQVLNYLLQSTEGITCKAAFAYQAQKIRQEKLRAKPRIFYHDESAWTCHPDDAKRVGEILKESFELAPKAFGIECMEGGDYVVGSSYADVH
jgi:DNA polymerase I